MLARSRCSAVAAGGCGSALPRSAAPASLLGHRGFSHNRNVLAKGPAKMVTKISDLSPLQISAVLSLAHEMKAEPEKYYSALQNETLLMLFEKPSLRTRVSLEVGMTEMGGHGATQRLQGCLCLPPPPPPARAPDARRLANVPNPAENLSPLRPSLAAGRGPSSPPFPTPRLFCFAANTHSYLVHDRGLAAGQEGDVRGHSRRA
eukprot:SAG22_NODE_478_length_9967_cov_12.777260_2_plen_204_part_00